MDAALWSEIFHKDFGGKNLTAYYFGNLLPKETMDIRKRNYRNICITSWNTPAMS